MITDTMTLQEVGREIKADYKNALELFERYFTANYNKYYRVALKGNKFPCWFKPVEMTTARRNKVYLIPHVQSKAELKAMRCATAFAVFAFHYQGSVHYAMVMRRLSVGNLDSEDTDVMIYPKHLLDRFAERIMHKEYANTLDAMVDYYKYTDYHVMSAQSHVDDRHNSRITVCGDMVLFVEIVERGVVNIVKTCISKDMLRENQNAEWEDIVKSNEAAEIIYDERKREYEKVKTYAAIQGFKI